MAVPVDWWRVACESISLPLACIGTGNKFVWVNASFEKLTGYSIAELQQKTWPEITVQEDAGGDLASLNAVIKGDIYHYSMAKRYRHKLGREIPVQIAVWRFPRMQDQVVTCFIVEAAPEVVNHDEFVEAVTKLEKRIRHMEAQEKSGGVNVTVGHQSGTDRKGDYVGGDFTGDIVGRDKSTNNAQIIKYLAGAVIAIAMVMAWLFYYTVTAIKPGVVPDSPPAINRDN